MKDKNRVTLKGINVLVVIMLLIFLIVFCLNSYSEAAIGMQMQKNPNDIKYVKVVNNREPRLNYIYTDPNYFYILLHDNAGIIPSKSYFEFDGKRHNVELIEINNGAYTEKGTPIFTLNNYNGKKYDYGIKIKSSELSTSYKNIFVFSYDYWQSCFLKQTFKMKKLEKKDKDGYLYHVDTAPRVTIKLVNGKPNITALDYSGVKRIKVVSEKTRETIYEYNVINSGTLYSGVSDISGLTPNVLNNTANSNTANNNIVNSNTVNNKAKKEGYRLRDGIYYPYRYTEEIDMNLMQKAMIDSERYKIRVVAEDINGISNEKTMVTRISSGENNITTQAKDPTQTENKPQNQTQNTTTGSFNLKHAINVSSKAHAKEHENLKWHGSTVGKHAGMIGAYVEAINILNGANYTLKEVYNKIISAHPEQKSKNKPVYENTDINNYYNIKVTRASASVKNIRKALDEGKIVAEIVNTTKWRNEKGKLFGKTGRHTGLIFYYDGKYYHMKTTVKKNAIYTEQQLKEWLGNTSTKLIIYEKKK